METDFGGENVKSIENPPIGRVLAAFSPRRVQPLSQRLAGGRMLILAQPQKIIRADFAGQTKPFRARAKPFAGHALAFIVVIPDAEMFFKVFPRVLPGCIASWP